MSKDLTLEYKKSQEFWNELFKNENIEKIDSKWIESNEFNDSINEYMKEDSNVLDYGSGTGFAIIEIYFTKKIKYGLGIDASINGIEYSNKLIKESDIKNIEFKCGDESLLNDYKEYFDFIISLNCLDVVPDEITYSILDKLYDSLKSQSYMFIGLNHEFSEDELINKLSMEKDENYFYKNGILRCNKKSKDEWIKLFSTKFKVVKTFDFFLEEREKEYKRMGFILQK